MSTCPQCYTGTCKRHKRQDNGRSLVKCTNTELTLQKMYDQFVGSKLQKLQTEAEKDPPKQHTKDFRKKLDASRDKFLRKSNKSCSKLTIMHVTGSGLNPQALAAIYGEDSNTSDEDRKKDMKKKKHRRKHLSISSRKRRRSDRDNSVSSDDNSRDDSDESHHRHKRLSSSRKHSRHHKKSHKMKKHKRSRADVSE